MIPHRDWRLSRFTRPARGSAAMALGLPATLACALAPLLAARAQEGPMPVLVQEVRLEAAADRFVYPGRTRAMEAVDLMARVEGHLGPAGFEDGQTVEAGALLFTIEPGRFEALVRQADAQLEAALAAEALAQAAFDRTDELAGRNVTAQSQLDEARASLAGARADVSLRRAGHELAKLDLADTRIHAPFAGRMSAAAFSEGALVRPSSDALARIVSEDPMEVVFPAPQRVLLEVGRQGRGPEDVIVRLRLADGSTYGETGRIITTDVEAAAGTDSVDVTVRIPNPERILIAGQLVEVIVEARKTTDRIVIPQSALLLDQQGPYVLAVGEGDAVVRADIEAGPQIGTGLEVAGGLEVGDLVIVSGLTRVQPGAVVSPQFARGE